MNADDKGLELVASCVVLKNGTELLTLMTSEPVEKICYLFDPVQILKSIDQGSATFIVRRWIEFSDDRIYMIPKDEVLTVCNMSDLALSRYNEIRKKMYLDIKPDHDEEYESTETVPERKYLH